MVSLKFHCKLQKSDFLELEVISSDSLHICVSEEYEVQQISSIVLDRQTAIKFSKELRKQIALLD